MKEEFVDENAPSAPIRPKAAKDEGIRSFKSKPRSSSDCDGSDVDAPQPRAQPPFKRSAVFQSNRINVLEAELEELTLASRKRSDFDDSAGSNQNGANWRSAKNNIENLINFAPIYHCLHIHMYLRLQVHRQIAPEDSHGTRGKDGIRTGDVTNVGGFGRMRQICTLQSSSGHRQIHPPAHLQ
ncbi:hypothetical protein Aperf_G00000025951 [Anoplocephala perfoliata]